MYFDWVIYHHNRNDVHHDLNPIVFYVIILQFVFILYPRSLEAQFVPQLHLIMCNLQHESDRMLLLAI